MTRPYINPRTLSKLMGGASEIEAPESIWFDRDHGQTGEAGSLNDLPTGWDEFCQVIIAGSLFVAVGNGLALLLDYFS